MRVGSCRAHALKGIMSDAPKGKTIPTAAGSYSFSLRPKSVPPLSALIYLCVLSLSLWASPPPNDNFANRLLLTGARFSFEGSTDDATTEVGEPGSRWSKPFSNGYGSRQPHFRTIWWTWTAPEDGILYVWARSDDPALLIDVFSGDNLASLISRFDTNDLYHMNENYLSWRVEPNVPILRVPVLKGENYSIRAGAAFPNGHRNIEGWGAFTPNSASRDFDHRLPLVGLPAADTRSSWAAMFGSVGDKGPTPTESWWSWTSPITGRVTATVNPSAFEWPDLYLLGLSEPYWRTSFQEFFFLSVTAGDSVTPLLEVPTGTVSYFQPYHSYYIGASPFDPSSSFEWLYPASQVTFDAQAGVDYKLRVSGLAFPSAEVTVAIRPGIPPVLDLLPFPNKGVYLEGESVQARAVLYENIPRDLPRKVEFLAVSMREHEPVRRLEAGTSPYSVAWNNLPVGFYAIVARTYDDLGLLAWSRPIWVTVYPSNRSPETAKRIVGAPAVVSGRMLPSRMCSFALLNGGDGCGVWWRWTAPADGVYSLTPEIPDAIADRVPDPIVVDLFDVSLSGQSLGKLIGSTVGASRYNLYGTYNSGGLGSRSLVVHATAGRDYLIKVNPPGNNSQSLVSQAAYALHINRGPLPTVAITSPVAGSTNALNALPRLTVSLGEGSGEIVEVQYYKVFQPDGSHLTMGESRQSPFSMEIPIGFGVSGGRGFNETFAPTYMLYPGVFTVVAKAIRADGTIGVSEPVTFTIANPNPVSNPPPAPHAEVAAVGPANDAFSARIPMGNSSAWFTGSGFRATKEADETFSADWTVGTVWWSFTPSQSGVYTLATQRASLVAVFTGATLSSLQPVPVTVSFPPLAQFGGSTFPQQTTFDALAGVEYSFALGDSAQLDGGSYSIRLRLAAGSPPSVTLPLPTPFKTYQGKTLHLRPQVTDPDGSISNVVFYLDTVALTNSKTPPFAVDYVVKKPVGTYSLYTVAYDATGLYSREVSDAVLLEIQPPPPSNDSFSARIAVPNSSGVVSGSGAYASVEPGEPAFFSSSVWWSFTPSQSGNYVLLTSDSVSAIGVYTGPSVSELSLVTNQLMQAAGQITFQATAGVEYAIGLSSSDQLTLRVVRDQPPSVAISLPNPFRAITGSTLRLSAVASDPDNAVSQVEYFVDGQRVATSGVPSSFDANYAAILWPGNYSLTAVAIDALGVRSSPSTPIVLQIVPVPPANNEFAARRQIVGAPVDVAGTGYGATPDAGESWAPLGAGNAWYSWTAPASGDYAAILTVANSNYPSGLQLFRGSSLESLELITSAGDARLHRLSNPLGISFHATAGETYAFAVWAPAEFSLAIKPGLAPSVTLEGIPDGSPNSVLSFSRFRVTTDADPAVVRNAWVFSPATNTATLFSPAIGNSAPFVSTLSVGQDKGFYQLTNRFPVYGLVLTRFDNQYVAWMSPPLEVSNRYVVRTLANDDFANRIHLTGTVVAEPSPGGLATLEPGREPAHGAGVRASAWWSWVAPTSGLFIMDSWIGEIFEGSDLEHLTPVRPSGSWFRVKAGASYAFAQISQDAWIYQGGIAFHLVPDELLWPRIRPDGSITFDLPSLPGSTVDVQASTNLIDWVSLGTNALSATLGLGVDLHDPQPARFPYRFYRAVASP